MWNGISRLFYSINQISTLCICKCAYVFSELCFGLVKSVGIAFRYFGNLKRLFIINVFTLAIILIVKYPFYIL